MNTTTKLENRIEDTQLQIESLKNSLANAAADLAYKMNRLMLNLEEGHAINSLGEVQSRGSEVDRLCALLHEAEKNLVVLKYIAE